MTEVARICGALVNRSMRGPVWDPRMMMVVVSLR